MVEPITDARTAYLSDAEFREKYTPLLGHFETWRQRLNITLGLDPLGSMETAVELVEQRMKELRFIANRRFGAGHD